MLKYFLSSRGVLRTFITWLAAFFVGGLLERSFAVYASYVDSVHSVLLLRRKVLWFISGGGIVLPKEVVFSWVLLLLLLFLLGSLLLRLSSLILLEQV